MKVEVISATRLSQEDFWARSALGNSLRRLAHDRNIFARIAFLNRRGLGCVYSESLAAADPDRIVAMVHDDVWIDDYFFRERLIEALAVYDVIGVAGNRRRVPGQPAWAFIDAATDPLTWDDRSNLSGAVAHGRYPFGAIAHFGPCPAECELLDGVLLAARKAVLARSCVSFDPRFEFHFYDMDFCRSARQAGLRLATWPLCVTHQSAGGGYGGSEWTKAYCAYLDKWGS